MKQCASCKKRKILNVDDIVVDLDGYMVIVKGDRCSNCGEEFIAEDEGNRMIRLVKQLGVWGEPLKLHRKLSQSARGTVLRIPSDIEKGMKLKGNEEVLISKLGPRKILIEL